MTHFTTKRLGFIGRVGPAFSPDEVPAAHAVLDRAGVPRWLQGAQLSLPERIAVLHNLLEVARARQVKQIVVISKREFESMQPEYQENKEKS